MKKVSLAISLLALVCAAAAVPATAATIYDSGTTTGKYNGWSISGNFAVTDQFTLTSGADVTSISFDVWLYPSDTLNSVDWAFGLAKYGSGVASGIDATTTGTLLGENKSGFDVYKETFSVSNVLLGDNTYWFTLYGANTDLDPAFWDENDGTSNGYQLGTGSIESYDCSQRSDCGLSGGETFTLKGIEAPPPVPEPSSFLLLGTGLAGIAGMIRRKLKA